MNVKTHRENTPVGAHHSKSVTGNRDEAVVARVQPSSPDHLTPTGSHRGGWSPVGNVDWVVARTAVRSDPAVKACCMEAAVRRKGYMHIEVVGTGYG